MSKGRRILGGSIVVVLALIEVVVMNAFQDGAVAVIAGQIQVRAPPWFGPISLAVPGHELVEVRPVSHSPGGMAVEGAGAGFHLV